MVSTVYFARSVSPYNQRGRRSESPYDVLQRFDGYFGCVQILKVENQWLAAS
jgi:hypothetical protein